MSVHRRAKPRGKNASRHPIDFEECSELNDRQRLFVTNYLASMNGSDAARRAGYAIKSAGVTASVLLKTPKIRVVVDAGLKERAMAAEEVLARLSDMGRVDFSPFTDEQGRIDLAAAKKAGLMRFVKRITQTEKGGVTVELYDAQSALVKLGERHRLWIQRQEHSGPDGQPIMVRTWADLAREVLDGGSAAPTASEAILAVTTNGPGAGAGNGGGEEPGAPE
jgi:hypothetical protein